VTEEHLVQGFRKPMTGNREGNGTEIFSRDRRKGKKKKRTSRKHMGGSWKSERS